jgi:hypothetical protein
LFLPFFFAFSFSHLSFLPSFLFLIPFFPAFLQDSCSNSSQCMLLRETNRRLRAPTCWAATLAVVLTELPLILKSCECVHLTEPCSCS